MDPETLPRADSEFTITITIKVTLIILLTASEEHLGEFSK